MNNQAVISDFVEEDDTVQCWSHHAKELKKTQVQKALKFLEYDLIRYIGYDSEFDSKYTFVVLPLNTEEFCEVEINGVKQTFVKQPYPYDYNKTPYKIFKNSEGIFVCNCQGWDAKTKRGQMNTDGCNCSHVLSLFIKFKLKHFKRQ